MAASKHNFRGKRYGKKNAVAKPSKGERKGKRNYRNYYHQQPSQMVYVEEPDSDVESESESENSNDDSVYEFDLQGSGSEFEEETSSELEDYDDAVDMNDELENNAVEDLRKDGRVHDLNDELLGYYNDEPVVLELGSEDEPQESLYFVDPESMDEDSQESDSSSSTADFEYSSDEEKLNEQLRLESVRQAMAEELGSGDELSLSSSSSDSSDSESDDGVEYLEVDSDMESSTNSESGESSSSSSSSDDDEDTSSSSESSSSEDSSDSDNEVVLYRRKLGLPDAPEELSDSENEMTENESSDSQALLNGGDEDNVKVIDLSEDLANSTECEVVELDANTYKLNLRLPSIVKESLLIDFLKNRNELIIKGKMNIDTEDSDIDDDNNNEATHKGDESDSSTSSESNSSSSSESESASDSSDSESSSTSYSGDSDSSSSSDGSSESSSDASDSEDSSSSSDSDLSDMEIIEDTDQFAKDSNSDIMFEKHFTFDKDIKFKDIDAKFLSNGELELIIPCKNDQKAYSIQIHDNT